MNGGIVAPSNEFPVCRGIDVTFDFRSDTPPGKDPDSHSPTLRAYHKLLWSKPLPTGQIFGLDDSKKGLYLHHSSDVGEFVLASDTVIPAFLNWKSISHILNALPQDVAELGAINYTIGGMMVFPGNCIGRKMTINGARGCHPRIKDRFDLTLECIRRHYGDQPSPLAKPLARYANFFRLFGDFRGYVEYFLLQDIVTEGFSSVKFFLSFDEFKSSPLPSTTEAYRDYRRRATEFIRARNHRIAGLA